MPQTQEHREVQDVVRAHAGWVFACAKGRVRDDALAEDVMIPLWCPTALLAIVSWIACGMLVSGDVGVNEGGRVPWRMETIMRCVSVIVAVLALGTISTWTCAASAEPPAKSDAADGGSQLNAAYGLVDGEVVKRIQPPFIPARMAYWKATDRRRREPPDQIVFAWKAGEFTYTSKAWGEVDPLAHVIQAVMKWTTGDFQGPADMLATAVPGDWVVRADATEEEKLAGLLTILQRDVDPAVTIQKRTIEREVIVAKGTFHYAPHLDARGADQVILYSDPYVADASGGGGAGTLATLLTTLGDCAGEQVVDEVEGTRPKSVGWHTLASCRLSRQPTDPARTTRLDSLLKNVAAQTGLTLTREKRKVSVWVVDRKKIAQSPLPAQSDGR